FDVDAFENRVIDVVAVDELEPQIAALSLGTVADAGDLEHLGEALGHARDEVLHIGTLHTPRGAVALRRGDRCYADFSVGDLILHEVVEQLHRQRALGALDRQSLTFDAGGDARGHRHRLLTDAGHQNTSARTSPPTFWSRASASDSTPRGVDTMTVPRPLRMRGSARAAE